MAIGKQIEAVNKPCGICLVVGHPTDMCPTLQEEQANAVGGFLGQPRPRYDPYSNSYNEGWKDHLNFRYGNSQQNVALQAPHRQPGYGQQSCQPFVPRGQPAPQNPQGQGTSLEDIVKVLASNSLQFQQTTQTQH